MEPDAWIAALETEGGRIAATDPEALAVAVPTTPGWTVADVIGHLGGVHRWAASYLAAGPEFGRHRPPPAPSGPEVLAWYRSGLDELLAEIARHDPAEPTRSFAGTAIVAFWLRRQAHETAIHRWDVDHALHGDDAVPIDTALAIDGIDEWLTFFVSRFLTVKGSGIPSDLVGTSLHLHCTDDDRAEGAGEWVLRLAGDRVEVEHTHAKGDAAVRGPASDLVLAVWHRLPLDRVDVVGDAALAARILDEVRIG